ncbi:i-AAA protease yme1 [Rhizina undulata]
MQTLSTVAAVSRGILPIASQTFAAQVRNGHQASTNPSLPSPLKNGLFGNCREYGLKGFNAPTELPAFIKNNPRSWNFYGLLPYSGGPLMAQSILALAHGKTSAVATRPCVRTFSTLPAFSIDRIRPTVVKPAGQSQLQPRRGISIFGRPSESTLYRLEQAANKSPSNVLAQQKFYKALLDADLPQFVVDRHQSGNYVSDKTCEDLYLKALDRLGHYEKARMVLEKRDDMVENSALSRDEVQAIGQAVAAQSRGGTIAISRGRNGNGGSGRGTGERDNPIYVVVDESIGGAIFKWVKFLFYFGLVAYFSLVFLSLAIEATGMLKKVGGAASNEAQPSQQTVRFSDVHGCDEAKEELQELVEFLKDPSRFSTLGGKLPKGVLLVGPPGTGKTLLARAVAGEAGVPFFFMSGSEFDEVYVGVGAKRVRELFAQARAKAPAIVFIDELDAIGGKRNERDAAYVKQTLNQLLVDLDGFSQNSGVIFLAATNFPQLLDKALTRPGRFDRNITVPLPDVRGRIDIIKHHMKNILIAPDIDASLLARGTPGFSGAELENMVNQAAVRASRLQAPVVRMQDFEWAKDKIMMGAERRSAVIPLAERKMTAYHEGGHAIVGLFTPGHTPVYKVTIMPRGQALGVTHFLPEGDQFSMTKKQFLAKIDSALGGKIAEELIYGPDNVTSGCSQDLRNATKLARMMVMQLGMSETLGDVDFAEDYQNLSGQTKELIEKEVRRIIEESRGRATKILTAHRKELDLLAKALVEYESLDRDEIQKVVKGETLTEKIKILSTVPVKLPEGVFSGPTLEGGPASTEEAGAKGEKIQFIPTQQSSQEANTEDIEDRLSDRQMPKSKSKPRSISELSPARTLLLAARYVAAGDVAGLRRVVEARGDVLEGLGLLRVLMCLPETAGVGLYSGHIESVLGRKIETDVASETSEPGNSDSDSGLDLKGVDGVAEKRARHECELLAELFPEIAGEGKEEMVARWLKERARKIDDETGALSVAGELLERFRSVAGVSEYLAGTVEVLGKMVYAEDEGSEVSGGLKTFENLEIHAAVRILLGKGGNGEKVAANIKELVQPYLFFRGNSGWESVWEFLKEKAKRDWRVFVQVVLSWDGPEGEKERQRVLRREYARVAIAGCYLCPLVERSVWDGMHAVQRRVLGIVDDGGSIPERLGDLVDWENVLTAPTEAAAGMLDLLATSAGILSLSLAATARVRFEGSREEQRALLARYVKSGAGWNQRDDDGWRRVRDGARWLRTKSGVLGKLSAEEVEKVLIAGMLAGTRFGLVNEVYVNGRSGVLGKDQIEGAVLEAFLEFYDNASNGNKTRGSMKNAANCLQLLQNYPSPPLTRAKRLLTATHALSHYSLTPTPGVPFLPVQIRIHPDPPSLLARLLDQNPKSYLQSETLITIAKDLSFGTTGQDGGRLIEKRVLGMCIEASLSEDDFESAYSLSTNKLLDTIEEEEKDIKDVVWRACYQAGRYISPYAMMSGLPPKGPAGLRNLEMKMELLAHAVRICPPATVAEVLGAWRRCEDEMETILKEEAEAEAAHVALGKPVQRKTSVSVGVAGTGRVEEEAPMGLFAVAAGAAKALRAKGSSMSLREDGQRARKRDVVSGMVTSGLASGLGWVLGAQPNEKR